MPRPLTEETSIGEVHHRWIISEYEQHERGSWWYIAMITLGLALVLYGAFTLNFLFSLIIILAWIILFLQSKTAPAQVTFQITELGIAIASRFYPYSELVQFYIIYNPPEVKTLFIETKSSMRPTIRIPLLEENPVEIRETLRQYLLEDLEREEEPMSDTLARRWKIH